MKPTDEVSIRRPRAVPGPLLVGAACLLSSPAAGQVVVDLPVDDRLLSADFEEVYRVGSLDGDAWETFGAVAATAFDARGNLYVLDRQASRITVVDRDGGFVREVGRPGEGPGELRMPVAFTVMPDGRIVIADLGHRAYQIFGPDGAFDRMVGMGDGSLIRIGDLAPDPSGEAVITGGGGNVIAMRSGPGAGTDLPSTRPIERIDLTGQQIEVTTIAEGWQPPRSERPRELAARGTRLRMAVAGPRTFEPELLVGALPDGGAAFSDSTAYAIKIASPTGGVTRILRRPFEPREVTERMEEAERERRLEELASGGGPRISLRAVGASGSAPRPLSDDAVEEMMRGQIEQMEFFPELPVLMGLATSWTGKIWAQRRGERPEEPGPIDVMTPEGRYMGTFAPTDTEIPDAFGPGGLAAYVELDELDVPTIVVRRLPPVLN